MSVPIKKWDSTKERVERLLTKFPETRDDLGKVISAIWYNDIGKNDSLPVKEFLKRYSEGKLTPAETIRRTWQKLQEKHVHLRGEKYNERHNIEVAVAVAIVKEQMSKEEVPEQMPDGYECPMCGNYVSLQESNYGEAILCARCPDGEYTTMEAVYNNFEEE